MANLAKSKRSYSLTIEKEDYKKVEEIAKKERRSVAFIINEAVKEYLTKKQLGRKITTR